MRLPGSEREFRRAPCVPAARPRPASVPASDRDGGRKGSPCPAASSARWVSVALVGPGERQGGRNQSFVCAIESRFPRQSLSRCRCGPELRALPVTPGGSKPSSSARRCWGGARPRRAAARSPYCSTLSPRPPPPVTCTLSRAHLSLHPAPRLSAARRAAGPRQARRSPPPPSHHAWGSSGAQWALTHV